MLWGIALTWSAFIFSVKNPRGLRGVYLIFLVWVCICACLELLAYRSFSSFARTMFLSLAMAGIGLIFYCDIRPHGARQYLLFMKRAYYFVLAYGVLQIIFGSEAVAIQNVTATYSDSFDEIINKHNVVRGMAESFSKIFSTYHNGNLFGVAVVLCAPLAVYVERRSSVRIAVLGAAAVLCVFSASAGAIGGGVVLIAIYAATSAAKGTASKLVLSLLVLFVVVLAFSFVFGLMDRVIELITFRVLDRDLSENVRWLKVYLWWQEVKIDPTLLIFGDMTPSIAVYEVLPIAMTQFFGFPSVVLFYVLSVLALRPGKVEYYKAGVIAYFIMSVGDGGFWLTPSPYLLALNIAGCRALDKYPLILSRDAQRVML